jgi:hypothetical protein
MADKRVTIQAGGESLNLVRVTEVKESEEIDSDIVKTFDEPVPVPSSDGGYTIDISALEARNVDEYKALKKIIKTLKTEPGELSVYEDIKHKTGNFTDERHYGGVMLSSNEVTVSAEDLTARDLSFSASSCQEIINDEAVI